jgi:hypothetical protein
MSQTAGLLTCDCPCCTGGKLAKSGNSKPFRLCAKPFRLCDWLQLLVAERLLCFCSYYSVRTTTFYHISISIALRYDVDFIWSLVPSISHQGARL